MDDELKTMWLQLSGWSGCLQDVCKRHVNGEPAPDPNDTRKPREHVERLLRECGEIYASIVAKENQ